LPKCGGSPPPAIWLQCITYRGGPAVSTRRKGRGAISPPFTRGRFSNESTPLRSDSRLSFGRRRRFGQQEHPRPPPAAGLGWLRGQDLNLRPSGYEPDELPGCSTPRQWTTEDRERRTGGCSHSRASNEEEEEAYRTFRTTDVGRRRTEGQRPPSSDFRRPSSVIRRPISVLCGPGDDLLSHVLRQSTIGAKAFDGRVRDGIGSFHLARATRPAKNGRRRTDDGGQTTEDG
jgi:hypothetical protein